MSIQWRAVFNVTPLFRSFPSIKTVAEQVVNTPTYHFEGRFRQHHNHCLFQYTLAGKGTFKDGTTTHSINRGTGFLCEVGNPNIAYFYPPHALEEWHFIFFSITNANEMVRELLQRFGPVYRLDPQSPFISRFREYRKYGNAGMEQTPGEGLSVAANLFATLADAGLAETNQQTGTHLVQKARQILRTHLEENFNIQDLAGRLGVSHEHLSRVFKHQTGIGPLDYLTQEKIQRACQLLKETNESCKRIALRLGYDNSSHFARTFRRIMGTTPTAFREKGVYLF